MTNAGLYIHIPFCEKKCGYCDFYSVTDKRYIQRFTDALIKEIQLAAAQYPHYQYDTIYVGGGTPSILPTGLFEKIWQSIHEFLDISAQGEFTIEANPGTLNKDNLTFFREMGLNRLSLGVQSFHEEELCFLGRIHSVRDVFENYSAAREAGFNNINIDLMTAFPNLTLQRFKDTLENAITLQSGHISCYTFIFEPGTPFHSRMKRGELKPLETDQEADFYEMANEVLSRAGYQAYEVSNFAAGRPFYCQHNLKYWKHLPYVGLGPSAHSFTAPLRWQNVRKLEKYLSYLEQNHLPIVKRENLNEHTLEFEYIYLHLRLREGIDLHEFTKQFHKDFMEKYLTQIRRLESSGMIQHTKDRLRLSPRGWLLADEIASIF